MNYYNPYVNNPYVSQMPTPALNGKIVENLDMAKMSEVPMGGFGIFPKADLSEIYIKSWGADGRTNLITYKPLTGEVESDMEKIMKRLDTIEKKLVKPVENKEKREF